jgi:hypothetical protein
MNKVCLFILVILVCLIIYPSLTFSQDLSGFGLDSYETLIEDDTPFVNYVTYFQDDDDNSTSDVIMINIILGFGIGSLLDGDTDFGISILILDSVSLASTLIGWIILSNTNMDDDLYLGMTYLGRFYYYSGLATLGISRIFSIIGPFFKYEKPKLLVLSMNLLCGFGLGSFSKGDTDMGYTLQTGDLGAFMMAALFFPLELNLLNSMTYTIYTGLSFLVISRLSSLLGLYEKEDRPLWGAILLNLTIGLGAGNIYQGDDEGRISQLNLFGYVYFIPQGLTVFLIFFNVLYYWDKPKEPIIENIISYSLVITPIVAFLVDRIYGVARAIYYYNNERFTEEENSTNNEITEPKFLIEPIIGLSDKGKFMFGYGFHF